MPYANFDSQNSLVTSVKKEEENQRKNSGFSTEGLVKTRCLWARVQNPLETTLLSNLHCVLLTQRLPSPSLFLEPTAFVHKKINQ